MQPIAQNVLSSISSGTPVNAAISGLEASGLKGSTATEKSEQTLIKGEKSQSKRVTDDRKRLLEVSNPNQAQSLKRLKQDFPHTWMTSTDIGGRKLEIVGLNASTKNESPGARLADAAHQHDQADVTQCDSPDGLNNINPTKNYIFQCQENCLELKLMASFDHTTINDWFSPTGKNLLISGCDSLSDHSLRTWRQGVDGNWLENGKITYSQTIFPEFNQSENTLLTINDKDNVRVSTLNSDGRWEKSVALTLPSHDKSGYFSSVHAGFSPLKDQIMSYDQQTGKINVLRADGNGRWTLLTQPEDLKTGKFPLPFKAMNNYLLTCNGTEATIWGCNDKNNCLEKKKVIACNSQIVKAQLSNDEQHALIVPEGNKIIFLACDVDGNWSHIAKIHHPRKLLIYHDRAEFNRIASACFNTSGHYALTRDTDNLSIVSGYDDNGAWVIKKVIQRSDYVVFSPSGRKIRTHFGCGKFKIWDCKNASVSQDKGQLLQHINSDKIIFSPSENLLITYGKQTDFACIWGDDGEGNLIEKLRIYHQGGIRSAVFNAQEDSVMSSSYSDCTVKIHGLDREGKWQEQWVDEQIDVARFSSSGHLALAISQDNSVCILGRHNNGKWMKQALTKPNAYQIRDAQFNRLNDHFLTFGNKKNHTDHNKPGLVQLWSAGDDGKWTIKEQITLDHPVKIAHFDPDGDHLIIRCENNLESATPKGGTALLWKIPANPMQS